MFGKTLKPFVFLVVVIAMVSLACLGGGEEPAPEEPAAPVPAEPEPTEPPPPEPTEPPQAEAQQFFTEEFDEDNGNWDFNVVQNDTTSDTTKASGGIADGIFEFVLDGKALTIYSFYAPYEYKNVKIDIVVENRGTNDNQINIICRATDEGWYEFSIANNGLYVIYAVEPGKGYRKLHDGGSTKIKPGKEINEYSVVCNERTLKLYVNGKETRVFDENEYVFREGQIGIGVSSFKQLPVKIEVHSVTISEQ